MKQEAAALRPLGGSNPFTPTWINPADLSVCFTISHSAGVFLSTPDDKLLFCVSSLGGDRPLLCCHKEAVWS